MKKRAALLIFIFFLYSGVFAADYYWVGGTGNWSDISHWSTSSGGGTFFFTPPTAADNVHFDANSFTTTGQSVTINTTAVCNDLAWTGAKYNPAFSCAANYSLRIYGSLTLITGMSFTMNGSVYFEATTTGKTITSAGKTFGANVYLQGIGGGWMMIDHMNVGNILSFINGSFNTSSRKLTCGEFNSDYTSNRTLKIANSAVIANEWKFNGTNASFDASNSEIKATGFTHKGTIAAYNNVFAATLDGGGSNFNLITGIPGLTATGILNADSIISTANLDLSAGNVNYITASSNIGLTSFTGGIQFRKVVLMNKTTITGVNRIEDISIAGDVTVSSKTFFVKAVFSGNGNINSDNSFDTLILASGKIYTFGKGTTQTITRYISINGVCTAYISMNSSQSGTTASISKTSGTVTGKYLIMKDVKASGGASFTANNSIDMGNNPGWTFNPLSQTDLYWVGGTGSWTDSAHWSTSSGGAGGACIPNPNVNVHFDSKSFTAAGQMVTLDVNLAYCRDMVWTGALYKPNLTGASSNSLHIYGSLTFISAMDISLFSSQIYFEATSPGKTLVTANKTISGNCYFVGIAGGWTLLDSLKVYANIYFDNGILNTNKKFISCTKFYSIDSSQRNLDISSSTISASNWLVNGRNLVLNSSKSLIKDISNFLHNGTPKVYNDVASSVSSVIIHGGSSKFNLINITNGTLYIFDNNNIDSLLVGGVLYLSDNDTINYLYVKVFALIGNYSSPYSQVINTAIFDSIGYLYGNNKIRSLRIDRYGLLKGNNIIGKALLYGDASINENNIFDTLSLYAGKTYTLQYKAKQTVNQQLNINGRCSAYITLESSDIGSQAEISKATGSVTGNYLIIRDVKASGGAVFTANNSIGVGSNPGWIINNVFPSNLYWVGGSGNWSDSSHWALSSGGIGSACIPGPFDNVFFDSKSFTANGQTVTMDISNANCNNMDWTGALFKPKFDLTSGRTIHIFGSLTLIQNMNFVFNGFASFDATSSGKLITSAGQKFNADVHFTGQGGEWTLQDSLTIGSTLYFLNGKLNTNSKKLSCSTFNSYVSTVRKIDISNSVLSVKTWGVIGINLTIAAAGSHIMDLTGFTHFYDPAVYNNISSSASFFGMKAGGSKYNLVDVSAGSLQLEGNSSIDSLLVDNSASISGNNNINFIHVKGSFLAGSSGVPDKQYITRAVLDSSAIIYGDNRIGYLSIGKIAYINGNDTMGNVFLYGDAIIDGNIIYDSLTFSPGKTYQLQDGKTQKINYELIISGNNCFPTSIRSRSVGLVATIYKAAGKVSADFIELRDIKASGGASFFAGYHSSNLGNSPGWNFTTAPDYIYGLGKDTVMCYGDLLRTTNINGAQTFIWQDSSSRPYCRVTKPGAYWVTAEFGKGCTYADTVIVTKVKPVPDAGFRVNDSMQCLTGNNFIFTDTSSIDSGSISGYTWLFGDGQSDMSPNPSHIFNQSDTFFTKLIAESSLGCKDTFGKLIYVYDPPKAGFTVNNIMQCLAGNNFIFTNTTAPQGSGKFLWDFGDGSKDTMPNTAHTYLKSDTFRVTLYAFSGSGCDDSFTTFVYVFPSGAVSFSVNDSIQCLSDNRFIFTDNVAGDTLWSWELGDGGISGTDSFVYAYSTADSFIVKLTVTTAQGCRDSTTRTVYVNPSPTAGFNVSDTSMCLKGNSFKFIPIVVDTNLQFIYWDFGDTNSLIIDTANHSYSYSGSYMVKSVFVSALGCTDSFMKTVQVKPSPVASFVIYDSSQCFERNDFGFINRSKISSGSLNYVWDFGDASASTLINPQHQYLYADTFKVLLKAVSQDGCTDSFSKNTYLHVHPEPKASFLINDSIQCFNGNSFGFTNTSTLQSGTFKQLWDFNDGTTSDSLNATHTFSTFDTFTARLLIISDWACKDSVMQKVYVCPMPKADFSINNNHQNLAGNSFVFTNLSNIPYGNLTYLWDFGDGATSSITNGTHSYTKADSFDVKLSTVSDAGCPDSITQQVFVDITITVDFTASNLCLGDTVVFRSTGNAYPDSFRNYIWDYGDGNNAIVWDDPVHIYDDTGTYHVTMVGLTYLGYKDTAFKTIRVMPKPALSISYDADTTFYTGGSITLTANGIFDSIFWSTGATSPSIVVKQAGIYSVRVIGNNGCDARDQIKIYELEMKPFEVMDVITPNDDGINDVWKIFNIEQYQPCKVGIYNRWGDEMFSTSNYRNDWDGTWKGKKLPEGTYYYFLETRDGVIYKGAVNIVR